MITQKPKIADPRYRRANGRIKLVCTIRVLSYIEGLNTKVDFWKLEFDGFDIKIESKFRQFLQVDGQRGVAPRRSVREFIVGQHVCSGLSLAQMFEADDGGMCVAGELGCLQAAMARNNLFVLI